MMTRKLASLILALVVFSLTLCSVAVSLAEMSNVQSINSRWSAPYNHGEWKPFYSFNLSEAAAVTAVIKTPDGEVFNTARVGSMQANGLQCEAGEVVLSWSAVNEKGWHSGAGTSVNYSVEITTVTADGETQTVTMPYEFHYGHDITDHQPEIGYYPNNTVCSFGPHFRDVSPRLTDKWYMFTPIDVSRSGVQVYELVAGNMWVIGQVYVSVYGDALTVTYSLFDSEIEVHDEFFTIFNSYDEITDVDPNHMNSMTYGRTYSIQNDLGGDTNLVLYINNRMSYNSGMHGVYRMWENLDFRKPLRNKMLAMIGR